MASNKQMKTEFDFFKDIWNYFKRFYEVNDSEQYWRTAVNEAAAINEKYNNPLCKDLLVAVSKELRRKGGGGKRQAAHK